MKIAERFRKFANMEDAIADRVFKLRGEGAFEVLARVRKLEKTGKHVVHLEIGEPDFDTPENVKEKAIEAIREGHTYYVPSAGI
ncbi:MAG: pyridoxal phosphate-dependent aminotransferase, partial [Candidatus Atribacteria bacterium]|nr:pyridoxal phosphate-dependent aminotransferase [Candidatus Atribacteria bacterium]